MEGDRRVKQRKFKKCLVAAMVALMLISRAFAAGEPVAERIPVRVVAAKKLDMSRSLSTLGTVNFVSKADVSAEIDGVLRSVDVEEGEAVTSGQVIAVIDSTLLEAQLKQTRAILELARIDAVKSKNEARIAAYRVDSSRMSMEKRKDFFQSQQRLFDIGGLTQSDLDRTEVEYKQALTEYQTSLENVKSLQAKSARGHGEAEERVAKAQADLDGIQAKLDKCSIKAPITGVVATQWKWIGERTKASDSVIVTIMGTRNVYAVADLNETNLGQVALGQRAIVTADAYPGMTFQGKIHLISPVIDVNSRTVKVKVKLSNDNNLLKHGMFVRVRIISDRITNAVAVPAKAVVNGPDGVKIVFVVIDDVAFLRKVQAKPGKNQRASIFKGVKEGELVVVDGQERLKDLSAVQITEQETR
jgi:multidrug efflux pump subunit AcrA (membrane-fusion protein)